MSKTPRSADTYRARRRVLARELHGSGWNKIWRVLKYWDIANKTAKLEDRAAQCYDARQITNKVMTDALNLAKQMSSPLSTLAKEALVSYWSKQKPARRHSRILRELKA